MSTPILEHEPELSILRAAHGLSGVIAVAPNRQGFLSARDIPARSPSVAIAGRARSPGGGCCQAGAHGLVAEPAPGLRSAADGLIWDTSGTSWPPVPESTVPFSEII